MIKDNIISIKSQVPRRTDSVTLADVKVALDSWRRNKVARTEKIPASVWDQVFSLLQTEAAPESRTLSALGLKRPQYENEKKIRQSVSAIPKDKNQEPEGPIAFCEAQQTSLEPVFPLVGKPAEAFSTATCVVELYRPDGMLMKIHICTDRFDELLRAFYNGCTKT